MRIVMRTLGIVLGGAGLVALVEVLLGFAPGSVSWYVARSSGLVAVTLLTVSVLMGIGTSLRATLPGLGKADTVQMHRATSVLAFGFLIVHLGALLADRYVVISVGNLVGVEASPYRPLAVLAGSGASWLMLVAATAFAWRRLLGRDRWRWLHRAGYGAWALGLAHAAAAGTDSGIVAVQWLYLGSLLSVMALLSYRVLRTTIVARMAGLSEQ